jgi:hypothetical protein
LRHFGVLVMLKNSARSSTRRRPWKILMVVYNKQQ